MNLNDSELIKKRHKDHQCKEDIQHKIMILKKIKKRYYDKTIGERIIGLNLFKKKLEDKINAYQKRRLITFSTDQKNKTIVRISQDNDNGNEMPSNKNIINDNSISNNSMHRLRKDSNKQNEYITTDFNYDDTINDCNDQQLYCNKNYKMIAMRTKFLYIFIILCSLAKIYISKQAPSLDLFILFISVVFLIKVMKSI